jgi:hypothetical protein
MAAQRFLRSILQELSIRLHLLHLDGLIQLAGFVSLCEGFLGIAPKILLFCRLFMAWGQRVVTPRWRSSEE